jgi:hypothetical protein
MSTASVMWGLVRLLFARRLDFHCPVVKARIGEFLRDDVPLPAGDDDDAAAAPAGGKKPARSRGEAAAAAPAAPPRTHHQMRLETIAGAVLAPAFEVQATDKVFQVKLRIGELTSAFPPQTTLLFVRYPGSSSGALRELTEYDAVDETGKAQDMRAVVEAGLDQLIVVTFKNHEMMRTRSLPYQGDRPDIDCPVCHQTGPSPETGHTSCCVCGWCGACCIRCARVQE